MSTTTDNWKEIEAESRAALPKEILDFIDTVNAGPEPHSQLISVLHMVQGHFGFLGTPQMDAVAQLMGIPSAKVFGVATFYHFFRLKPRGKYVIYVCLGTACYVKGADRVVEKIRDELGIDFGETTTDGLFSLDSSRCLGTCGLAPVVMIGDTIHGKLTPDKVPALLETYIEKTRVEI